MNQVDRLIAALEILKRYKSDMVPAPPHFLRRATQLNAYLKDRNREARITTLAMLESHRRGIESGTAHPLVLVPARLNPTVEVLKSSWVYPTGEYADTA